MWEAVCRRCGVDFVCQVRPWEILCTNCVTSTCEWCGEDFKTLYHKSTGTFQKTCSLECRSKLRFDGNKQLVSCDFCGEQILRTLSDRQSGKKLFCDTICRTKYFWKDKQTRKKMIKGIKASIDPVQRKKQLDKAREKRGPISDRVKDLLRKARVNQRMPTRMTSIEKLLKEELERRGLLFEMYYPFAGKFQPDFAFPEHRVFVQADGDYWHSLPEAVKRDRKFNELAIAQDWTVFRFCETSIKEDVRGCVDMIMNSIGLPTQEDIDNFNEIKRLMLDD